MTFKVSVLAFVLLCAGPVLQAQTKVEARKAELSVTFGTVVGTAVLVGDYLVFIDEKQVESSFAIARNEIENVTSDGRGIIIETRLPIRDRSGERNQFSIRLVDGDLAMLMNWSRTTSGPVVTAQAGSSPEMMSFPAEFTQFLGRNSRGRLMVTADMVAYESIDNVGTSRRWQFKDLKEIKLKNPYEIEIDPFVGDKYNLRLEGKGMDSDVFKTIVDRITASRIAP